MPKEQQPLKRTVAPAPSTSKKKPYRAPRLVEYGDLRTITQAKGGNMDDGTGVAATKK